MAKRKGMSGGMIVAIIIGIPLLIVGLDMTVLNNKLGIKAKVRGLMQTLGVKSNLPTLPITAADRPEYLKGIVRDKFEGGPAEAALLEEQELLAAEEPETAFRSRRRWR